jgi:hypothetical protein
MDLIAHRQKIFSEDTTIGLVMPYSSRLVIRL